MKKELLATVLAVILPLSIALFYHLSYKPKDISLTKVIKLVRISFDGSSNIAISFDNKSNLNRIYPTMPPINKAGFVYDK